MTVDRIEYMLRQLPLAQSISMASIKIPPVLAPSLEGLSATVTKPGNLTLEQFLKAAEDELFEQAVQRERKLHDPVEMGDVVCIDLLGYSNGRLLPLTARFESYLRLMPQPELPGFAEAIAGTKVGDTKVLKFDFPPRHSQPALRGQPAVFMITVHEARSVKLPDPTSAAFLKKVGAKTYDAWLKQVEERLEEATATALALEAQNRVLDVLANRVELEVPVELINEEIRRKWAAHEGRGMAERAFKAPEQQEALDGWLQSEAVRAETTRALKISLVLKSIVDRDGLKLDPKRGKEWLLGFAADAGMDKRALKAELSQSKWLAEQVAQLGLYMVAVEHVMSKAKVKFQ